MKKDLFRYRIITNLQCNNRCSFCYQTYKPKVDSDIILDLNTMRNTMQKVFNARGVLSRATIMGGESLLLPNIDNYVRVTKNFSDVVCIVTNGKLITHELILRLRDNGLDEIAISIYSLKNFNEVLDNLLLANEYIPNMRVNIPRCNESSYEKLKYLVELSLDNGFGCVVCEDLMGRYGEPHDVVIPKWDGVIEVKNDYNFITYKDLKRNKEFGLFAHYSGYNETDFIITPVGNFSKWEKYCNKIENYDLR